MFRYPGGKTPMLDSIIARQPAGRIGAYRETMHGGASVARRIAQELHTTDVTIVAGVDGVAGM